MFNWFRRYRWGSVYDPDSREVHVVPIKDLVHHEHSEHCVCMPKVELIEGSSPDQYLYTHSALHPKFK